MSRDDATLLDMLKAARLVVAFKGKLTKKAFLRDIKTQSAILHQLLVIGEAVKRLSEEFRGRHPQIPSYGDQPVPVVPNVQPLCSVQDVSG